jgi:hypothetical protein
MPTLSLKIPEALGRKLARAAKQRRLPKAAIVREVLDRSLPAKTRRPLPKAAGPRPSAYELMKDLCGIIDSAASDLSTNKEHLAGLGRDELRP